MYYYLPHPDDPRKVLSYCSFKYCPEALITDKDIVQGNDGELYFAGEEPAAPLVEDTPALNPLFLDPNFHKAITPDYTRVITLGNGAAIPDYGFLHAVFWVSVQNVNIELHHSITGQVIELGRQHLGTNENFDMPSITLPVSPGWTIHYSMKCVCWHIYFCPFHQV